MNIAKQILKSAVLAAVCIMLTNCIFDDKKSKKSSTVVPAGQGYFPISFPNSSSSVKIDSIYTIYWSTGAEVKDSIISIYLYDEDEEIMELADGMLNTGQFSWYTQHTLGSGSRYRIKIVNVADTSQFDFSYYFSMHTEYYGTITVAAPYTGQEVTMGESFTIRWASSSDKIGSHISINLYKDSELISTIDNSEFDDGQYTWSNPYSVEGSGSDYQIQVASTSDPGIKGLSGKFTLVSQYSGSFNITSISDSTVVKTGNNLLMEWEPEGQPGSSVSISLYKDTAFVSTIDNSAGTTGSQYWSVPASLESGDDYKIKISSRQDPGLFSFSEPFTIEGLKEDSFEPDSLRDHGVAVELDLMYSRTLARSEDDWFQFNADSGKTYVMTDTGSVRIQKYLYLGEASNYTQSFSYSSKQNIWTCEKTGTYYVRLTPYSSYFGEYGFQIMRLRPAHILTFQRPTSDSEWETGSTYEIKWTPDSTLFENYVKIYLYSGDELALTIRSSSSPNNGSYSWSIPNNLTTGDDYRIRIVSYNNAGIYGQSEMFTINGLARDEYEPDTTRLLGVKIVMDSSYRRTLVQGDDDWFSFAADSGTVYVMHDSGTARSYKYLYKGDASNYFQNFSYSSNTNVWTCTETGTYHVRLSPYSSNYGEYTFAVQEINPNEMLTFLAPISGTAVPAGSNYEIKWIPNTTLFGSYIELYLDNDTGQVAIIRSSSTSNNGSYTWSVPNGLLTDTTYKIRIENRSNADIYALSPAFTISGVIGDTFEPDNTEETSRGIKTDGTKQIRSLSLSDRDWLYFDAEKNWMYVVDVESDGSLYLTLSHDGQQIETKSGTSPRMVFTASDSGLHHLNVRTSSSSGYGNYSISINGYNPQSIVNFISPNSSTTLPTGISATIEWEPDSALFPTYVNLYLVRGDNVIQTIRSTAQNSGSHSWTPTNGLATASDYQIKISDYSNTQISGYSDHFAVSGVMEDSNEPNDSLSQAVSITSLDGTQASYTLTYQNDDWFKFSASADKLYLISAAGGSGIRVYLYSEDGGTLLANDMQAGLDSSASVTWISSTNTILGFKVDGSYTGDYQLSITEYNQSAYSLNITSPSLGDSLTIDELTTILWENQIDIGGTVNIFLYNSQNLPYTISTGVPNDGTQPWTVPIRPDGQYHVRIESTINANISGNSDTFTIYSPL